MTFEIWIITSYRDVDFQNHLSTLWFAPSPSTRMRARQSVYSDMFFPYSILFSFSLNWFRSLDVTIKLIDLMLKKNQSILLLRLNLLVNFIFNRKETFLWIEEIFFWVRWLLFVYMKKNIILVLKETIFILLLSNDYFYKEYFLDNMILK